MVQRNNFKFYFLTVTKCEVPKNIENGNLILPSSRRYLANKKALLRCHHGFLLLGNNVSICTSSGEWTDFGVCIRKLLLWKP